MSICDYAKILGELIDFAPYAILMGQTKKSYTRITDKNGISTVQESEIAVNTVTERIIFTTYQFCSKGISIPRMDAIILAQPRKSDIQQVVGRILRAGGDYRIPRYIIDIIDENTTLRNQFTERRKVYRACGCTIHKKTI